MTLNPTADMTTEEKAIDLHATLCVALNNKPQFLEKDRLAGWMAVVERSKILNAIDADADWFAHNAAALEALRKAPDA